jgi:class 3 adenylate cyclase/pimeloyl-ACP methyl ester carboxylesterase
MVAPEVREMPTRRFAVVLSIDVVGYSRMMQRDAAGLLAALNSVYRALVRPMVAAQGGRIVKLMGDGALVEFPSAFGGVVAAVEIQRAMSKPEVSCGSAEPIRLRMGLHAGDVIVEGEDIFGDCVNLAQRLQAAAEPGGVLLSGTMAELAGNDLPCRLRAEGRHEFRNIARPIETFSAELFKGDAGAGPEADFAANQEIRFCRTRDGLSLAWTETGEGPTVVRAPHWISHLGLDWQSTHRRMILGSLSRRFRLVRYDTRGNGLSSRDVEDISFDRLVDDLESVFDVAGVDRAPIFAISQGCAIAAAFAARAPERVSGIVMIGGYPQGRHRRASSKSSAKAEALNAMIGAGWDDPYPSLRDLLANRIVPMASMEERRAFAEQMRQMMSAEELMRYRAVLENTDVTGLLGQVRAPCLVIHCSGDRMQPTEQGQMLAVGIPNARFTTYDSPNHVFTANDPCWPAAEREIHAFLAEVVGGEAGRKPAGPTTQS